MSLFFDICFLIVVLCFLRREIIKAIRSYRAKWFKSPNGGELPVLYQNIVEASNSVCKISYVEDGNPQNGTGFFIELPTNEGESNMRGLMTNHHILHYGKLKDNSEFEFETKKSLGIKVKIVMSPDRFCFTSELLDFTFIELFDEDIADLKIVKFLQVNPQKLKVKPGESIYSFWYYDDPKCDALAFSVGHIKEVWGFDWGYNVYTAEGASGAVLFNHNFDIVGIHKRKSHDMVENFGVSFKFVINAINTLYHEYGKDKTKTATPPKILSEQEIKELEEHGLRRVNENVFISPSTWFYFIPIISPLWFYRTNHAWYWTPKRPKSFSLNSLKKCNWSLIRQSKKICARGGMFGGLAPARRNVELIKWLIDSGLKYLRTS